MRGYNRFFSVKRKPLTGNPTMKCFIITLVIFRRPVQNCNVVIEEAMGKHTHELQNVYCCKCK